MSALVEPEGDEGQRPGSRYVELVVDLEGGGDLGEPGPDLAAAADGPGSPSWRARPSRPGRRRRSRNVNAPVGSGQGRDRGRRGLLTGRVTACRPIGWGAEDAVTVAKGSPDSSRRVGLVTSAMSAPPPYTPRACRPTPPRPEDPGLADVGPDSDLTPVPVETPDVDGGPVRSPGRPAARWPGPPGWCCSPRCWCTVMLVALLVIAMFVNDDRIDDEPGRGHRDRALRVAAAHRDRVRRRHRGDHPTAGRRAVPRAALGRPAVRRRIQHRRPDDRPGRRPHRTVGIVMVVLRAACHLAGCRAAGRGGCDSGPDLRLLARERSRWLEVRAADLGQPADRAGAELPQRSRPPAPPPPCHDQAVQRDRGRPVQIAAPRLPASAASASAPATSHTARTEQHGGQRPAERDLGHRQGRRTRDPQTRVRLPGTVRPGRSRPGHSTSGELGQHQAAGQGVDSSMPTARRPPPDARWPAGRVRAPRRRSAPGTGRRPPRPAGRLDSSSASE